MIELTELPETFDALRKAAPDGYSLSERLVNPIILIDRIEGRSVAKIVGSKTIRGAEHILFAPSIRHTWVVDANVLRPLPADTAEVFSQVLNGADPENLSYKAALDLLARNDSPVRSRATQQFLLTGAAAAQELPEQIEIPGLNADLFPYQAMGIRWMLTLLDSSPGLILADEMGLGKTLQVIALLVMTTPRIDAPALIVCPTSLIANWLRELTKFAPHLSVQIHRGSNRAGIYRQLQTHNVVITTYDTMVNDISIISAFEWSWLIFDEAQALKTPDSQRRQAAAAIPRLRAIPMTGTPVENGLLDIWSLVDIAIPGLLGSRAEFQQNFPDSVESAKSLSALVDPIILKRRVVDVAADLPERIDIDLPLELDGPNAEYYRLVRRRTLAKYPIAGALVATLQLQLTCAHPWLSCSHDSDADDAEIEPLPAIPLVTPKIERVVALLNEAFVNKQKVIIFALFNRCGALIRQAGNDLPDAFWGAINGSTPQEDRQSIIDEFAEFQGPACLVLNPKAAGAGLNITAATIVIHLTPLWNPALESQASARAHRRGQTRPVTVYRLFYENTVERVMIDRSHWKRLLGNEIVPLASRDAEDLQKALTIEPPRTSQ